jgi:hypothetical protein
MLEFEHPIPNRIFVTLKPILGVPNSDPAAVGAYPVRPEQVERFEQVLGLSLPATFLYFVEPAYEDEDA